MCEVHLDEIDSTAKLFASAAREILTQFYVNITTTVFITIGSETNEIKDILGSTINTGKLPLTYVIEESGYVNGKKHRRYFNLFIVDTYESFQWVRVWTWNSISTFSSFLFHSFSSFRIYVQVKSFNFFLLHSRQTHICPNEWYIIRLHRFLHDFAYWIESTAARNTRCFENSSRLLVALYIECSHFGGDHRWSDSNAVHILSIHTRPVRASETGHTKLFHEWLIRAGRRPDVPREISQLLQMSAAIVDVQFGAVYDINATTERIISYRWHRWHYVSCDFTTIEFYTNRSNIGKEFGATYYCEGARVDRWSKTPTISGNGNSKRHISSVKKKLIENDSDQCDH